MAPYVESPSLRYKETDAEFEFSHGTYDPGLTQAERQLKARAYKRPYPIADPAPLGLAGFATTTFILSAHNAGWAPDIIWVGAAFFYGGLVQLLAGMWEFRNNNMFGATAFSTYGGFWLSLALFVLLDLTGTLPGGYNVQQALGWFLAAFTIFTTYMLLASTMLSRCLTAIFFTLECALICLFVGNFVGNAPGDDWVAAGGYIGVVCAVCAYYTSGALVFNCVAGMKLLPLGQPFFRPVEHTKRGRASQREVPSTAPQEEVVRNA